MVSFDAHLNRMLYPIKEMSIKVIQCFLCVISGSIGSSKPEAFTEGQLSNTYANLTYH